MSVGHTNYDCVDVGSCVLNLIFSATTASCKTDELLRAGSMPLVVAFGRCSRVLLLLHRSNISSYNDGMLEQSIVNLVPFLKEIRSRFVAAPLLPIHKHVDSI